MRTQATQTDVNKQQAQAAAAAAARQQAQQFLMQRVTLFLTVQLSLYKYRGSHFDWPLPNCFPFLVKRPFNVIP